MQEPTKGRKSESQNNNRYDGNKFKKEAILY